MLEKSKFYIVAKSNLQAIPVCLAALVLWAIIGGWYVAVVPLNIAGTDNIGIVLSIFGICLFLADRIASVWLHVDSKVLILSTWILGLAFVIWGLFEWLHSLSRPHAAIFIFHWSVFLIIIASTLVLMGRRRKNAE